MPLIAGLDTETTGFEASEGHRIIEICVRTFDTATQTCVDAYLQRIDPERNIPAAAQAVHGISYEELVGMPKWHDVAAEVSRHLQRADLLVAHNMGFDGPFIAHELARVGAHVPTTQSFCTMENARWACPDGKYPKLEELCFALNVPFDRALAHSAAYDVDQMMACLWAGVARGFYKLPETRI